MDLFPVPNSEHGLYYVENHLLELSVRFGSPWKEIVRLKSHTRCNYVNFRNPRGVNAIVALLVDLECFLMISGLFVRNPSVSVERKLVIESRIGKITGLSVIWQ